MPVLRVSVQKGMMVKGGGTDYTTRLRGNGNGAFLAMASENPYFDSVANLIMLDRGQYSELRIVFSKTDAIDRATNDKDMQFHVYQEGATLITPSAT